MTRRVRVGFISLIIGGLPAVAWACPACKQLIAEHTTQFGSPLGLGLYWSILVLLSIPFALIATVTWLLVRATRRHQGLLRLTAGRRAGSPTAG